MYLVDLYLEELSKVRDPKTVEKKKHLLIHLEELRDFSKRDLFEFYEKLRQRLSHGSALEVLREVRLFYEWLKERGYHYEFSEQAFRELKKKREFENRARKYFTEEEVETILSYIRTKPKPFVYYLLCVVLLSSGLRISEVIRKQLDSLKEGQAFFTHSLRFPKSIKVLTLSRDAVYRFFYDLSKELGIDAHPHRFRYTYAVWLAMKNIPPNVLKEFLGHSSVRTTFEVYAQAQKEKVLDLIASL
jgi:integrase